MIDHLMTSSRTRNTDSLPFQTPLHLEPLFHTLLQLQLNRHQGLLGFYPFINMSWHYQNGSQHGQSKMAGKINLSMPVADLCNHTLHSQYHFSTISMHEILQRVSGDFYFPTMHTLSFPFPSFFDDVACVHIPLHLTCERPSNEATAFTPSTMGSHNSNLCFPKLRAVTTAGKY